MAQASEAKKTGKVTTPLHLLQTLTRSLKDHLGEACQQAEQDAHKALEKINRQHAKLDAKLVEARDKLSARQSGAENKSVSKAQDKVEELEQAMSDLGQSREAAETYIKQLKGDIRQTLRLAKGFDRIETQVNQAIDKRDNPQAAAEEDKPRRAPRRNRGRKSPAKQADPSA
ncbi:hypothetical protein SAMN05216421_3186 [Halopseudomonas xinjiangensis]|uniref:Uncharacterized protein n=1 Tax=Halopseudomonas xinjiangensis TaxID=487184 RepID=A0A1H1YKN9_9GAMM|nr:AlgP family protein [Halopseudomonas xinjiangensis]SDT21895.1 hypothetical protein SAMN05216421_3186 [Halopseudomonas xinjiangensis]